MRSLPRNRVAALHRLRTRFEPAVRSERAAHLEACTATALTNPSTVLKYHETLLFMAAHPESRRQAALVDSELQRVEVAAPSLFRTSAGEEALSGSGLAGENIEANFSMATIEWLLSRCPDQVGLAWYNGDADAELDGFLSLSVLPAERDGRVNDCFDLRRWLTFAVGGSASERRELQWVIDRIREAVLDLDVQDLLAECLGLCVQWRLRSPGPTRTRTRFPARKMFVQRTAMKRKVDASRLIRTPLPVAVTLSPTAAHRLIDVARGVLAVRQKETDPVTYANPREVMLFNLDRGVDIALFGLLPERRLPIESYFGFVAARNTVPVAYGGAWILDRRAEVGIHVFETFRGGESAYLFCQVLRTFRDIYNIKRFQVDPYQFGADNADAIRSRAFWFYYRFGFRPKDRTLRQLAVDEWSLTCHNRDYRTPAKVLRRFTKSHLILDLDTDDDDLKHADSTRLGAAVTESIRNRFGHDRVAAQRWAERRVNRVLEVDHKKRWSSSERLAFNCLCPLIAILPGVATWSAGERRALIRVMRSKGGSCERDYVENVQRHERLRTAFAAIEASIDWRQVPARPGWRAADRGSAAP